MSTVHYPDPSPVHPVRAWFQGPNAGWTWFAVSVAIALWGLLAAGPQGPPEQVVAAAGPGDAVATPASLPGVDDGLAARGAEVFQMNGCYACHSITGDKIIGPSLLGVYGETQQLADGSRIVADEDYLRESIRYPQAKLVEGYTDAAMPDYEGLLTDEDIDALTEYIKSLRNM